MPVVHEVARANSPGAPLVERAEIYRFAAAGYWGPSHEVQAMKL